jgi:hypothetical protein
MLGLSGCNFITPQATAEQFPADAIVSDGISGEIGEGQLLVRNALLISEDGDDANLVATFVNRGEEPVTVGVGWEGAPTPQDVVVPAGATVDVGHGGDEQTITLTGIDATLGSLFDVYMTHEGETGQEFQVPVLDGGLPEYEGLAPVVPAE